MPAWKPGGQMNHGHELDGNSTRGLRCSLASHHEMRAVFRNSVSFLSQRQLTCACTFILSSPLRVCHQQSYETWTHCVHRSHPMTMKWDAVNEWIRISEQKISLPTGISQSIFVPCVSNVRVHRVILCLSSSIAQSICQRFRTVQIENATKFTTILNIQSKFYIAWKCVPHGFILAFEYIFMHRNLWPNISCHYVGFHVFYQITIGWNFTDQYFGKDLLQHLKLQLLHSEVSCSFLSILFGSIISTLTVVVNRSKLESILN